jgi:hypothetical protein
MQSIAIYHIILTSKPITLKGDTYNHILIIQDWAREFKAKASKRPKKVGTNIDDHSP